MSRESVISDEHWGAGLVDRFELLDPVTFGIDATPDRASASIGAAADLRDGRIGVEVVAHAQGLDWIVERAVELNEAHGPKRWVVDPRSPAGSKIEALRDAGLEVLEADTTEHVQACGEFYDDATSRVELRTADGGVQVTDDGEIIVAPRLAHLAQPVLDAAVAGAERRNVGDAWLWGRRKSTVDVSPLVAITLARWGHTQPLEDEDEGEDWAEVI